MSTPARRRLMRDFKRYACINFQFKKFIDYFDKECLGFDSKEEFYLINGVNVNRKEDPTQLKFMNYKMCTKLSCNVCRSI